MSFQAPFDIMDFARLRMTADQQQQQQEQQQQQQIQQGISGALQTVAGLYANQQENKNTFVGNYRFLTDKGMLSPQTQNAALDLIEKNKYEAANALISPYLSELDYGRKMQMAGRSGFFDDNGMYQSALRAEPVAPANKYGYRYPGP
jgi:TolA-binding protein